MFRDMRQPVSGERLKVAHIEDTWVLNLNRIPEVTGSRKKTYRTHLSTSRDFLPPFCLVQFFEILAARKARLNGINRPGLLALNQGRNGVMQIRGGRLFRHESRSTR